MSNNLVYANSAVGILVSGPQAALLMSDTVEAPGGLRDRDRERQRRLRTAGRHHRRRTVRSAGVDVAPDSENGFKSDYNFFDTFGAAARSASGRGVVRPTLALWHAASGTDNDSQIGDPLFVRRAGGGRRAGLRECAAQDGRDDDFHLMSAFGSTHGGSLAPVISLLTGLPVFPPITVVDDQATSPALDRGAASDPYQNEPSPNGGYINLGAFGNTAQASTSPSQFILVLQPSAATTVQDGTAQTITWRAFGFAGTVSIAYSADGGATFTSIASGRRGQRQPTAWSVPSDLAPGTDYVIQVSADAAAVSGLSAPFAVSARIHDYYVNDSSTAGDQYTTAVGDDANDGLTPATPKASIQGILAAYTLGAGDTILVDTGTYASHHQHHAHQCRVRHGCERPVHHPGADRGRGCDAGPWQPELGRHGVHDHERRVRHDRGPRADGCVLGDRGIGSCQRRAAVERHDQQHRRDRAAGRHGRGQYGVGDRGRPGYGAGNSGGSAIYLGDGNTGALVLNETAHGGYYAVDSEGAGQTVQGGQFSGGFYGGVQLLSSRQPGPAA